MSEVKVSDSSGSDSDSESDFRINKIKPINKRLKVTSDLFQLQENNKKRKSDGKLSIEQRQKEKRQNLKRNYSFPSEKSSRSNNVNQKNKNLHFSNGNEISQSKLELTSEKNKSQDIQKNSNGIKCLGPSDELKNEELPESNNIKNTPIQSITETSKLHLSNEERNEEKKFQKSAKLLVTYANKRKKFKNNFIPPTSLMENEIVEEQRTEMVVKLTESQCSVEEKTKNEVPLNIMSSDDKNEIKFEELPSDLSNQLDKILKTTNESLEEKYKDNSELLSFLLKKIIRDETAKQMEIEEKSCRMGRTVQKLISKNDCEIFEKFFALDDNACKLFVRMLLRKNDWHRVSTIVYNDIDKDLEKYFNTLVNVNFIDINIESENLDTQLNLLKKPEVIKLCKEFNISFKSHNTSKKDSLIKSLIQECRNQKSVLDIMRGKSSSTRLDLLKSQIKKYLGMCIKINQTTFQAFYKIILLFSFPHYIEEEEARISSSLYLCLNIHKNFMKFPNYKFSPTVVFEAKADFEEYEASLKKLNIFEGAISNKNHDEFIAVVTEVKESFINVLKNHEYQKRFSSLPSFLQKFSAGTVYARILTKYCQTFKRMANDSDIVETVKLLLDQNFFLQRKRGDWYEILSKALENQKQNNAAAEVIITSLKDPMVNEVQRLTLQLRGQGILRKKTSGISDLQLKEALGCECVVLVDEPASIEIKAKALDINESGFKCVYIHNTEYGKKYISVEETAISYYKSHGFPKGYHVEGSIIHSLYFIMFFDIIYGLSPEGVFQSPYQEAPLDFYSTSFYLNRKNEIDKLLADLPTWDDMKVETTIKDVYSRNCNTTCIINWNNEFTPELFCEVIKCITLPILVLIFRRLIQNFRVYRSGFPDLTLWNSETNEIKFVEVKSLNDKLSPAQRVWLNYLKLIGLNSEVCNVRHSSGKNYAE